MTENHLHTAVKFQAVAREIPDYPCTIQGNRHYTFGEVNQRSNALADIFLRGGIQRGDRVAVMERNSTEYIESYLAAQKLAAVPLNVNYKYQTDELKYILHDSEASVLVIHEDFLDVLKPIREECPNINLVVVIGPGANADLGENTVSYEYAIKNGNNGELNLPWEPPNNDDLIFLLYTGGTTGFPKGVMWGPEMSEQWHLILGPTVRSLLSKLKDAPSELFAPRSGKKSLLLSFLQSGVFRWLIAKPWVQQRLGDLVEKSVQERLSGSPDKVAARAKAMRKFPNITLIASPLTHGTGFFSALNNLAGGDPLVFLEGTTFSPAEFWKTVERESVRTVSLVGDAFAVPILDQLLQGSYDTSSIVIFNSSGVAFSPRIKQQLLEQMPQALILDSYAASEGLGRSEAVLSSDGEVQPMKFKLTPNMKVFNENDEEVKPGSLEVGQLAVTGLIPRGYWRDEEKTNKTFRTINGVRYSMIGDMAQVYEDGTLKLLGRGSGCINTGGEKVYPEEVESVIKELDAVYDCAVVGVNDERWGQAIHGIVAPHPGKNITSEQVIEHCSKRLANYKKPKQIYLVDEVPRQNNGKLIYPEIRQTVMQRAQKTKLGLE